MDENHYLIKRQFKTFEQAANQIANFIVEEQLPIGTKIPPERQLSEQLNISRPSVREGLRVLNLLKYLDSRQGEGTFVSTSPPFLLPDSLVEISMDEEKQRNYYGIFLMCSEKIILSSLKADIPVEMKNYPRNSHHPFWVNFINLIESHRASCKKPYLLALWDNIYVLLEDNNFFQYYQANVAIEELQMTIEEKDILKILALFENLHY